MDNKPQRFIITGANGFVGRHLCAYLASSNKPYEVVSRPNKGIADVEVPAGDVLIHLAGRAHVLKDESENPKKEFFDANCHYALTVARKAHASGIKRFVYVSSVGVYGVSSAPEPITEQSPLEPTELYAESKLEGELQLQHLSKELGFELVIVRPALVYGFDAPGNIARVLKFLSKSKIVPFSTARNQRTFLSVHNLSAFLELVATHQKAAGEAFNIADQQQLSTYKFYRGLALGMGDKAVFPKLPRWLWKLLLIPLGKNKLYQQLFENLSLSTNKARNTLNWRQPYDAENELVKTGQHYITMYKGENVE